MSPLDISLELMSPIQSLLTECPVELNGITKGRGRPLIYAKPACSRVSIYSVPRGDIIFIFGLSPGFPGNSLTSASFGIFLCRATKPPPEPSGLRGIHSFTHLSNQQGWNRNPAFSPSPFTKGRGDPLRRMSPGSAPSTYFSSRLLTCGLLF